MDMANVLTHAALGSIMAWLGMGWCMLVCRHWLYEALG